MYCKKCGKKVSDDSNYCSYCGTYLADNNTNSCLNNDPRVNQSNLFHTVDSKNINIVKKKVNKFSNVLVIINSIISWVSIFLMFFMMAFLHKLINFKTTDYPFLLGIYVPLIILLILNSGINIYFLVKIISNKSMLFKMIPLRIVSILLCIISVVLLLIILINIKPDEFNITYIMGVSITLFSIVLSFSVCSMNKNNINFIK